MHAIFPNGSLELMEIRLIKIVPCLNNSFKMKGSLNLGSTVSESNHAYKRGNNQNKTRLAGSISK